MAKTTKKTVVENLPKREKLSIQELEANKKNASQTKKESEKS